MAQFKAKDITNNRHDMLVAKCQIGKNKDGEYVWLCVCDCGGTTQLTTTDFRNTSSCGCLLQEVRHKHGLENVKKIQEKSYIKGTNVNTIQNCKPQSNNKSGIRGVCWAKYAKKWRVSIKFQGKQYYLGYFKDIEDAKKARLKAENEIFGEFLKWYNESYKKE